MLKDDKMAVHEPTLHPSEFTSICIVLLCLRQHKLIFADHFPILSIRRIIYWWYDIFYI